jgi:glutathione synthase/RimK-type ligase-like ATP-grasp enzyme
VRPWSVVAAFDRFPSRSRPGAHRTLLRGLGSIPVANPPSLAALCSDKLATQHVLTRGGIRMPDVETDPRRFATALAGWGTAFLKPRYGAFGRGVRVVRPGEPLPAEAEGAVPGVPEPTFLQRRVHAPAGFAGISARVLVQRLPDGTWHTDPVVARCSRTDPVVNAARGSSVVLLESLVGAAITAEVAALSTRCMALLANEPNGDLLVEGGVDVAIDEQHRPWVLEVNGTPRGRLEVLRSQSPDAFHAAHVESCARPLRTLAARFGSTRW